MTNWKKIWNDYPRRFDEKDFARQVGLSVDGQPYNSRQVEENTRRIASAIDIQPDDAVLDICCGNGLFTEKLAPLCARIVGVDFSEPLIDIARRYHQPANVEYLVSDARRLD